MQKYTIFIIFFFIVSCSNIDLLLKDTVDSNPLENNTAIILANDTNEKFSRELYSFFGNNKNYNYILKAVFVEKKENIVVKTNQVAEKVEYSLEVRYDLFYKTTECKIFSKKIISNFYFTPKSAGYNFGTDRSFDKLYTDSIRKNIQDFINFSPFKDTCIQ